MALKTARLTIDCSLLPQKSDKLGVRFDMRSVAKIKAGSSPSDMVLIRPAGMLLNAEEAIGPEPRWNCIICGIRIQALDGTNAQGRGQLLITGQRLIGMIENGKQPVADHSPWQHLVTYSASPFFEMMCTPPR